MPDIQINSLKELKNPEIGDIIVFRDGKWFWEKYIKPEIKKKHVAPQDCYINLEYDYEEPQNIYMEFFGTKKQMKEFIKQTINGPVSIIEEIGISFNLYTYDIEDCLHAANDYVSSIRNMGYKVNIKCRHIKNTDYI